LFQAKGVLVKKWGCDNKSLGHEKRKRKKRGHTKKHCQKGTEDPNGRSPKNQKGEKGDWRKREGK